MMRDKSLGQVIRDTDGGTEYFGIFLNTKFLKMSPGQIHRLLEVRSKIVLFMVLLKVC